MDYIREHPMAATVVGLFVVVSVLLAVFDAPFTKSLVVTPDGAEVYATDFKRVATVAAAVTAAWYFWPDIWAYVQRWL